MADTEIRKHSLGEIISQVREDAQTMLRSEIALVRGEMTVKLKQLAASNLIQAGYLGAGLAPALSAWLSPLSLGLLLMAGALATWAAARSA